MSRRLIAIASYVPQGAILADIGSDHGLLIEYCLKRGIIQKGYATDNKQGPYQRLLKRFGRDSHIGVYLADGLAKLPLDVDTVVIAGMGGNLMSRIIQLNQEKLNQIKHFILSPHQQEAEVRRLMMNLGYKISHETIVNEDDKFYDVIVFIKGQAHYTEQQLTYGPINLVNRSKELVNKIKDRIDEIHRILINEIPSSKRRELEQELEYLTRYDQNK